MTHDYHEGLPGFSPAQLLHDGCTECAAIAAETTHGIAHLGKEDFARAWARAAARHRDGLDDVARAEVPMLTVLWAVQLKLHRFGCPIGTVPGGS